MAKVAKTVPRPRRPAVIVAAISGASSGARRARRRLQSRARSKMCGRGAAGASVWWPAICSALPIESAILQPKTSAARLNFMQRGWVWHGPHINLRFSSGHRNRLMQSQASSLPCMQESGFLTSHRRVVTTSAAFTDARRPMSTNWAKREKARLLCGQPLRPGTQDFRGECWIF